MAASGRRRAGPVDGPSQDLREGRLEPLEEDVARPSEDDRDARAGRPSGDPVGRRPVVDDGRGTTRRGSSNGLRLEERRRASGSSSPGCAIGRRRRAPATGRTRAAGAVAGDVGDVAEEDVGRRDEDRAGEREDELDRRDDRQEEQERADPVGVEQEHQPEERDQPEGEAGDPGSRRGDGQHDLREVDLLDDPLSGRYRPTVIITSSSATLPDDFAPSSRSAAPSSATH